MRWNLVAQSAQGTGHQSSGIPCQDSYASCERKDGLVLVVSDGASSASHSHIGSQFLVNEAVRFMQVLPALSTDFTGWSIVVEKLLTTLVGALPDKAAESNCSIEDLASTFLLAAVTEDSISGVQVGDGAMVYASRHSNQFVLPCKARKGEYANETTFCLPDRYEAGMVISFDYRQVERIALLSDGLESMALHTNHDGSVPHAPFFNSLFELVNNGESQEESEKMLKTFLESPRVCERTDDDKTLLIASRQYNPE